MRQFIILAATILFIPSCATVGALETSAEVTVVEGSELPSPTGILGDSAVSVYRIAALDRIVLDVYAFSQLSAREIEVDESGRISVPLAGSVTVGGLTPAEAEILITDRMRAGHVRNPQVTVNLKESANRTVTVDGQVTHPGNFPILSNMTLMKAVAAAGGTDEFAKLDDVVVFRTVNGQRMAALYNLAAIRRAAYGDPRIYPMDIVVVGNSPSRRIFRDVLLATPLLALPLVAVIRR